MQVRMTSGTGIRDDEIHVYPVYPSTLDICGQSALYATVPSPLAHIIVDYKNLRQAQIRRAHADAWNTTAKLICSFKPSTKVQEDPSSSLMDFADDTYLQNVMDLGIPGIMPLHAMNMWSRDSSIRTQVEISSQSHRPEVLTLPRDHDVARCSFCDPRENTEFCLQTRNAESMRRPRIFVTQISA